MAEWWTTMFKQQFEDGKKTTLKEMLHANFWDIFDACPDEDEDCEDIVQNVRRKLERPASQCRELHHN